MPELAEVKRMSDFINMFSSNNRLESISVLNTKNKERFFGLNIYGSTIKSKSRGKELLIEIGKNRAYFSMGMSGTFLGILDIHLKPGRSHQYDKELNSMIKIEFKFSDRRLLLIDQRNFAKWRIDDSWGSKRGPCPLDEWDLFRENVLSNLNKAIGDKPGHLALMNQEYFNGIGNYLRAEIFYLTNINPFIKLKDYSSIELDQILIACNVVPTRFYLDDESYYSCYSRKDLNHILSFKDKNNRTFWYKDKWKKYNQI